MEQKIIFVIGATATGKSTFIREKFADAPVSILNVYDYQQQAYANAGFEKQVPLGMEFKCLYEANKNLLTDIQSNLQQGKTVVVEHTLYKAKRRITYIDQIRAMFPEVIIEVYIMKPSDSRWKTYIKERNLSGSFQGYKNTADMIEFPNPSEGFDKIFEVSDVGVQLRMLPPNDQIIQLARKELEEEEVRVQRETEAEKERINLLASMSERPFWHYCECCGKKSFITAEQAFNEGWDYPPQIGSFGLLGPRTCGDCRITDTLYWKIQQQAIPIVIEQSLSDKDLTTWKRIKSEPYSLLEED